MIHLRGGFLRTKSLDGLPRSGVRTRVSRVEIFLLVLAAVFPVVNPPGSALVFLSLAMLIWYSISRWVLHRKTLSKASLMREIVQLVTGLIFLPLFLYGAVGAWTAFTLAWILLVAGYYAVFFITKSRPTSINNQK